MNDFSFYRLLWGSCPVWGSTRPFKAAHDVIFSSVQHPQTVCCGVSALIWPWHPQTGNLWAPVNFWCCRSTARGCVTVSWGGHHIWSEACLLVSKNRGIFLLFQYLLLWNQSVFYGNVRKEREKKQAAGPWGIFLPTAVGQLTKMMGNWVRWIVLWRWVDARLDAVLTQRFPKEHVLVVVSERAHAAELHYHAEDVCRAAALP